MRILTCLSVLSLFFTLSVQSAETGPVPVFLRLTRGERSIRIPFYRHEGLLMNDLCRNDLTNCKAFRKTKTEPAPKAGDLAQKTTVSNPADVFCKRTGGVLLILTDEAAHQIGICAFDDKTLVSAWGAYRNAERHPK